MQSAKSITVKPYEPPYDLIITGISPRKYQISISSNQRTAIIGEIERQHYTGGKFGHYWYGFVHVKTQNDYYSQTIGVENKESTYIDNEIKNEIQNSIYVLLSRNKLTISELIDYSKVN